MSLSCAKNIHRYHRLVRNGCCKSYYFGLKDPEMEIQDEVQDEKISTASMQIADCCCSSMKVFCKANARLDGP